MTHSDTNPCAAWPVPYACVQLTVHGYHCAVDTAVRMRGVLARPHSRPSLGTRMARPVPECVTCIYCLIFFLKKIPFPILNGVRTPTRYGHSEGKIIRKAFCKLNKATTPTSNGDQMEYDFVPEASCSYSAVQ